MTSHSPGADRADQMIAICQRLVTLVSAEVEALKARKLDGATIDWDEKERLAHAWRIEVSHVKANPALLAGCGEDRKTKLKELSVSLEAVLEAHAVALSAMKDVSEGLVRTIATEIAATRSAPAGYGRTGAVNPTARRDASGVAVNAKA
jgi:hypothetical protein